MYFWVFKLKNPDLVKSNYLKVREPLQKKRAAISAENSVIFVYKHFVA